MGVEHFRGDLLRQESEPEAQEGRVIPLILEQGLQGSLKGQPSRKSYPPPLIHGAGLSMAARPKANSTATLISVRWLRRWGLRFPR